jgi:hypothetical protein
MDRFAFQTITGSVLFTILDFSLSQGVIVALDKFSYQPAQRIVTEGYLKSV